MIFTKALTYKDIEDKLDKNDVITIIGCESCVRSSGSGGEERMRQIALKLRADGFNVKDGYMVPGACTPKVLFTKLGRDTTAVISLACSAGTSNINRYFGKYKVVEATRDIGLMLMDSDKKVLKVTMPYQGSQDEMGKEYKLCTGEKTDSDNNIPVMEVTK